MKFNDLVKSLLGEGGFIPPIGMKRRSKIPNATKHGTMNQILNVDKVSPAAHSGFKGDTPNSAMMTVVMKQPKIKPVRKK